MFGGLFDKIIGNPNVMKAALGGVKADMEKKGVSCIILQLDPAASDEDTPGLSIKTYQGNVGILTGDDLSNYLEWIRGAGQQDAEGKLSDTDDQWVIKMRAKHGDDYTQWPDKKEVENV